MNLIQSILTQNPCYTCGRTITPKGLMLHSVGCPQPSAAVFVKNWNRADYTAACVHAFIDANTGDIHQTLPWNRRGWHGASGNKGCCNDTHIGVEMCEPACIKYTGGATFTCSDPTTAKAAATRTYNAAVELFAMLCKQFHLDPLADGVIISHKEGAAVKADMSSATVKGYTTITGTAKATVGQMGPIFRPKTARFPIRF